MNTTEMLDIELAAYEQHRDHLLATAKGKYVLVHDDQVIGSFDTQEDAINQGYDKFGNVPFLVKEIAEIETPQNFVSSLLGV